MHYQKSCLNLHCNFTFNSYWLQMAARWRDELKFTSWSLTALHQRTTKANGNIFLWRNSICCIFLFLSKMLKKKHAFCSFWFVTFCAVGSFSAWGQSWPHALVWAKPSFMHEQWADHRHRWLKTRQYLLMETLHSRSCVTNKFTQAPCPEMTPLRDFHLLILYNCTSASSTGHYSKHGWGNEYQM